MTKFKKDAPVFQVEGLEPYTLPDDGEGGYLRVCPDPSCPAHHRFFAPYWRLNEHMKTDHGWPRKSLQPSLDRRKNGRMRHPRSKTDSNDLLAGPAPVSELDDLPSKSAEYRAAHPKKRRRATDSTLVPDLEQEDSTLLLEGSEPPTDDGSLPVHGPAPIEDGPAPDRKAEASSEEPFAPPPPKRRRANPRNSVPRPRPSRVLSRPLPLDEQAANQIPFEQPVQGSVLSLLTKQLSPPTSLPVNEPGTSLTTTSPAPAPYPVAPVPSMEPVKYAASAPLYPFRDLPVANFDGTNSPGVEATEAEVIVDEIPIPEPPVIRTPVKKIPVPKPQVNIVIDHSINRTDDAMRSVITDFIQSLVPAGSTLGQESPHILTRLREMLDTDTVRVNRKMSANDAKDLASIYAQVAEHAKLKHDSIEASSKSSSSSMAYENPRPTKYDQMPPIHTFKTAPQARKQHPLSSVSYPGSSEDNIEPVNGFYTFSAKPEAEQMDWSPTSAADRTPLKIRLNMTK